MVASKIKRPNKHSKHRIMLSKPEGDVMADPLTTELMIPEQDKYQLVVLLCCVLCFFLMWGAQKLTHILQN